MAHELRNLADRVDAALGELNARASETDLTAAEAAVILDVERITIQRWCEAGKLPGAFKEPVPGGWRWRIPEAAVKAAKRSHP